MLAASCTQVDSDAELGETASELSVANWSAPVYLGGVESIGTTPGSVNTTTLILRSGRWAKRLGPGSWTPFSVISGQSSSARPGLAAFIGFVYMIRMGSHNDVYMSRFDPSTETWSLSAQLPYQSLSMPAIVAFQNKLWIFGNSPDTYQMWSATMDDMDVFSQATFIDGKYTSEPASAAVFMNRVYLAHRQLATNNIIYARFDGTTWTPNQFIFAGPNGAAITGTEPVIAAVNGFLHIVYRGTASSLVKWSYFDTCVWSPEVSIGSLNTSSPGYGLAQGGPGLILTTRLSSSLYVSEFTAPPAPRLPPSCSVISP
jgi:hypothetical protein